MENELAADAAFVAVGTHDITLPIEGADVPTVVSVTVHSVPSNVSS